MTARPDAPELTAAELRFLDRPDAPESLRMRVIAALLTAVLGTDDGDLVDGDFEIHASEIARLIVENGADAALDVVRGETS